MEAEEVISIDTEDRNTKKPTQKRPKKNKTPSIEDINPYIFYFT